MKNDQKTIVIGGGLAGLSCAAHLAEQRVDVQLFEANPYLGGRTASWDDNGMMVESGLHRYLGFYSEMPALLKKVGIDLDKLFYWEDEIVIRLKGGDTGTFGAAPLFKPLATMRSLLGNNHIFTTKDKLQIAGFFAKGIWDAMANRKELDSMTILEYAKKHGIAGKLIVRIVTPLSAGLFFLPPDRYSAFVFFALFLPYLHRSYRTRVGAFKGGMTQVMANPIGDYIQKNGGQIATCSPVEKLLVEGNAVRGVVINGSQHLAEQVVLAASVYPAQQIIKNSLAGHAWFEPFLSMQTMPSVTIQIELSQRSMPKDRTTFAPETCLASFSEQSESTFKHLPGRLSIILTPPEKFINMPREETLEIVCSDLDSIGIHIRDKILDYRIVVEPREFYALVPGAEALKPTQQTPIQGLYLAGDYTRQRYLATMEGAVYSGKLAAQAVLKTLSSAS
jgi:15-cis-phytoene desaturase